MSQKLICPKCGATGSIRNGFVKKGLNATRKFNVILCNNCNKKFQIETFLLKQMEDMVADDFVPRVIRFKNGDYQVCMYNENTGKVGDPVFPNEFKTIEDVKTFLKTISSNIPTDVALDMHSVHRQYRYIYRNGSATKHGGVLCFGYELKNANIYVCGCFCNAKDVFSKREARRIIAERWDKHVTQIPFNPEVVLRSNILKKIISVYNYHAKTGKIWGTNVPDWAQRIDTANTNNEKVFGESIHSTFRKIVEEMGKTEDIKNTIKHSDLFSTILEAMGKSTEERVDPRPVRTWGVRTGGHGLPKVIEDILKHSKFVDPLGSRRTRKNPIKITIIK